MRKTQSAMAVEANSVGTIIHATAIVHEEAEIGQGVEIGPYSIVGPHVKIGKRTKISSHVVIDGYTEIGERCEIFPGVCIGTRAQDKKYKEGMKSYVRIGDENLIREYVTVHSGSTDGSVTAIGHKNFLMAYCHIAHDCTLGNEVVMANHACLSGYVKIEDKAFLSGYVGVHQFVRVGKLSMIGGLSKIIMDVVPFSTYDGHPAKFVGLNSVGLRRAGYSSKDSLEIKKALKILFASGLNRSSAVKKLKSQFQQNKDVAYLLGFIENSKRGVSGGAFELVE